MSSPGFGPRLGLKKTLLCWFLLLSLVPMTAVSILSYLNARESLKNAAEKSLKTVSKIMADHIRTNFSRMQVDLQQQSEILMNIYLLENLKEAFKESNKPLHAFVKSENWATIVDVQGADLRNYWTTYGYHDIFLIDDTGNILFSLTGENDLGTNLFTGKYAKTRFADACRKSLETGGLTFSDFEFYAPSNNQVAGFFVSVMRNESGKNIGVIAFQVQSSQIESIMVESIGMGKTEEAYLIGPDLKMRSNCHRDEEDTFLVKRIETEPSLRWHREFVINRSKIDHTGGVQSYKGPHGIPVLGVYATLKIADVPFAVIAEIEAAEAFGPATRLKNIVIILLCFTTLIVLLIAAPLVKRIVLPIQKLSGAAKLVAEGNLDQEVQIESKNEIGILARSFNRMVQSLRLTTEENQRQDWFKTGQSKLNDRMRGNQGIADLSANIITFLAKYLNAQTGAIYLNGEHDRLRMTGTYAFTNSKTVASQYEMGEGLVGQAAMEKDRIVLTDPPEDYFLIRSGLGEAIPRNILVFPFLLGEQTKGVLELGTLNEFSDLSLNFLEQVSEAIAVAVDSAQSRTKMESLLHQTQKQAEQLEGQQEELRATNEELEEQTTALRESEAKLQAQQEELQETNESLEKSAAELEEQTTVLESQKSEIEKYNAELEKTQQVVEEKAKELELTSKYKTEFLANMSHELRTPLNSILILSKLLADNKNGNLSEKQAEYARTVLSSGTDLLSLINEVLDLSKVEAGKTEVNVQDVGLQGLVDALERNFRPVARDKSISLDFELAEDLPAHIRTDRQRLEQILKNFFSNAFKFTPQGGVTLRIERPENHEDLSRYGLKHKSPIAFSVSDTGIGVQKDKQKIIFEAFQQADGTTSRKYGGTGLGLSISREFAKLLGGGLRMESEEGKGSTFTLYLPETYAPADAEAIACSDSGIDAAPKTIEQGTLKATKMEDPEVDNIETLTDGLKTDFVFDDRKEIKPDDKSILIIEDDPNFAKILLDLSREKGFKAIVAENGETGLHFVDYYHPSAIILDVGLPGIDGWAVMSRLKENLETRHIPVHFISGSDKNRDAMRMGAIGFLEKPVNMESLSNALKKIENVILSPVKELLVVEDDERQQRAIADIIGTGDVSVTAVASGKACFERLQSKGYDCIILDLGLPDMPGTELLSRIKDDDRLGNIPVIVYTAKELTSEEESLINQYAEKVIIKGVHPPERLLDETSLFLHRIEAELPEEKREILRMIHDKELILKDKKILIVDDDMRNVFALSSILEEKGMEILAGKNGKEGIETLKENPDVNLVLMDIMMPEMDGYEAMGEIRKEKEFKNLPIIALTAKAMKGDRAKCIEAGADDYLAKPVDTDKLLSLLRVWLY